MFKMEVELREALIYGSGNESGLYEEMCQRRDAIIQERKNALEEEARQIRLKAYAIKRKKEQRIQNIQEWLAVVVGVSISSFIMYAVWWMFRHGGDE
jgi:3-hydroxy-3-methylglutaryl CoA synthase